MAEATSPIIFSFIGELQEDDDILEFPDLSLSVKIVLIKHQLNAE